MRGWLAEVGVGRGGWVVFFLSVGSNELIFVDSAKMTIVTIFTIVD